MEKTFYGLKSGEGTWLWLAKILSGALVAIILFIHLVVNHLVAPNGLLSYAEILKYYQNPIIPVMEILFVCLAVPHALIGLRGIILDLKPTRAILNGINWLFTIVGAVAIIYGIWLILTIVSAGTPV
jgi:succinate dehydrogenase hydrophobic anchor subunit